MQVSFKNGLNWSYGNNLQALGQRLSDRKNKQEASAACFQWESPGSLSNLGTLGQGLFFLTVSLSHTLWKAV